MKYDPVKLLWKWNGQGFGILSDPVDTDVNLSLNRGFFPCEIECYDVGEKIVLQKFLVYFQQVVIRAEDIVQAGQGRLFLFKELKKEKLQF